MRIPEGKGLMGKIKIDFKVIEGTEGSGANLSNPR